MSDFIKFAVGAGFWRFVGCLLLICCPLAIMGETVNRLVIAVFDWRAGNHG